MVITKTITLCDSCMPVEREAIQSVMLNRVRYDLCESCYAALEIALVFLREKVKVELVDLRVEVVGAPGEFGGETFSGAG